MHILVSAYRCSPYDVSEALTSFRWITIILKRYRVVLLTTEKNRDDIIRFFHGQTPEELTIHAFPDNYPLRRYRVIASSLKLGYFLFDARVEAFLRARPELVSEAFVLLHRSPVSSRYLSCLRKFPRPFVFGPIAGGLRSPRELGRYFRRENALFKLRDLEHLLMRLPPYRKQWSQAAAILASLPYVRERFEPRFQHKIEDLIEVGIDCREYQRRGPPDAHPLSILFVGFLIRSKGAELAIRAFAALDPARRACARFDIVGGKGEEQYLRELVRELGLHDRVVFHGIKDREEVKEFYERASIFYFPSLKEPIGNVYLEAMSYSLPVLTVANGGGKHVCPDEGAIKIELAPEDVMIRALTEALSRLIDDAALRASMGRVNREFCLAHYDWRILERRIFELFDRFAYAAPAPRAAALP